MYLFIVLQIHYSFHRESISVTYRYTGLFGLLYFQCEHQHFSLGIYTRPSWLQYNNRMMYRYVWCALIMCWYYCFLLCRCIGILCYWGLDLHHGIKNKMIVMRKHPHYIQVCFSCALCVHLSVMSSFYRCRNFNLHSGLAAVKNRIINTCIAFLFTNI